MDNEEIKVDSPIDEVAVTTEDAALNQAVSIHRKLPKRKLLIILSCLLVIAIAGVAGTKYYFIYQEKQKSLAILKAEQDATKEALTASKSAFDSAQQELTVDSYKNAITDLKKVISADPHYAQAQKQITILSDVSDLSTLMLSLSTDKLKFDSALTQFNDSFESLRGPMNSASQYPYPGTTPIAMSYIGKADTLYFGLSNSAGSANECVTAISNDLGSIASNSHLSSFGNTNQILSNYQDISNQVSSIKTACRYHIDSLKNNYLDYTLVSKVNSSRDKLGEDTISVNQGIAALTGFANGKVNDLLKEASALNQ